MSKLETLVFIRQQVFVSIHLYLVQMKQQKFLKLFLTCFLFFPGKKRAQGKIAKSLSQDESGSDEHHAASSFPSSSHQTLR